MDGLRSATESLASGLTTVDRSADLAGLVGSAELRAAPVHRWYYYKEGFSPRLPTLLAHELGVGGGVVLDPFAGVGTTLLSLQTANDVTRVDGIEYSPFAHFVASAKLGAAKLDPDSLRSHVARLIDFHRDGRRIRIPPLSSLGDSRIFDRNVLYDLLGARDAVAADSCLEEDERAFLLLGVAAIVEDVSGVMKDGRALRILNGRRRRPNALSPTGGHKPGVDVRSILSNQWLAMIEDIEATSVLDNSTAAASVHRGDARGLRASKDGECLVEDGSVGLAVFSPPYLNCIDYSEVYKLELWILGLIETQAEFRSLREGTLRSHPSVAFPQRESPFDGDFEVFRAVREISGFLEERLPRAPVGRMVAHYFQDMFEVFKGLARAMEPGASIACVVANSTFARRGKSGSERAEDWRMPVLTDVLLARLAEAAGFIDTELWAARDLRPRNVSSGSARESVVVARRRPG